MTKICHMTCAHAPEDVRIFNKECTSLADEGYEVFLVERGNSYKKNGVNIIGVGDIPNRRLKRIVFGARKIFTSALELNCDIYHFHDPELLPYGYKLKKKNKIVIFDSHENTADVIQDRTYLPGIIRRIISKIYRLYEKHICEKIDAVITVTPTETAYFKNINQNTVEVTNYPIIEKTFIPPTFQNKSVCFAGGINKLWNHDLIIKALAHIDNCKYVLCGAENAYLESLKQLPGWRNVDYRGRLPHDKIPEVLSTCMIGIAIPTPSRNSAWQVGTMGNTKIFEEMMAGLPVVCTDFVLWKEFVERYNCGICVDPKNEAELVEAIKTLLSDPDKAKKMGENGREAVIREYNWDKTKLNLIALYEKLSQQIKTR